MTDMVGTISHDKAGCSASEGSECDTVVGQSQSWADFDCDGDVDLADTESTTASTVSSRNEELQSFHTDSRAPCSISSIQAPSWQWVPVTMVCMPTSVSTPGPPICSLAQTLYQRPADVFDLKSVLEARKASLGLGVLELAAASRRAEEQAAVHEQMSNIAAARSKEGQSAGAEGRARTTVMIRNVAKCSSRATFQQVLDSEGFSGKYDFLYLPYCFNDWSLLGHAFVNFQEPCDAERAFVHFDGRVTSPGDVPYAVCWSEAMQGLTACVGKYQNSPVMHPCVADKCKPMLLRQGGSCIFPGPTKTLQPVRRRAAGKLTAFRCCPA